jgi:hypothetical protein
MKRVFSSETLAEVVHYQHVLEQNGIGCTIKNEQLSGALGEVPFLECLPELWVLRDQDLEAAERLLTELRRPVSGGKPWRCRHCKEDNDAAFAACWNCGQADAEV